MGNWAEGVVVVRGDNPESIQKFLLHFQFDERNEVITQMNMDEDYLVFARAHLHIYRIVDLLDIVRQMGEAQEHRCGKYRVEVRTRFSCSASLCVLDFPYSYAITAKTNGKNKLITLLDAANNHNVWVEVFTEEIISGFQEHILINNDGKYVELDSRQIELEYGDDYTYTVSGGFENEEGRFPFRL